MQKFFRFSKAFARTFSKNKLTRAAAALSYYLTMTFFPLVICLYTMLGRNYENAKNALSFAESIMAPETRRLISEFLTYVASNHNKAMLFAGIALLITSSSAAERSVHATIGDMQGGVRFQGIIGYAFSIIFALLLLAAFYFSILVILMGSEVLSLIKRVFPTLDADSAWIWLRFFLLAGIGFVLIWGLYDVSKRQSDKYRTFPGAIMACVALLIVSLAFSGFIGASAKYPLVYGSLTSIILLMLWLYTCCLVIYCGAAVNICLRDIHDADAEKITEIKIKADDRDSGRKK